MRDREQPAEVEGPKIARHQLRSDGDKGGEGRLVFFLQVISVFVIGEELQDDRILFDAVQSVVTAAVEGDSFSVDQPPRSAAASVRIQLSLRGPPSTAS